MVSYASYILCAFLVLHLYGAHAGPQGGSPSVCLLHDPPNQCGAFCMSALSPLLFSLQKVDTIIDQQTELKLNIERKLQTLDTKAESELTGIKESIRALNFSLESIKSKVPLNFEKIGSRFFYIEKHVKKNWFAAANTCRKMGGYLATIQDQEEMTAIAQKLPGGVFWLDITDLAKEGEHISSLTGRRPPFFNWKKGEPAPINEHCVNLYTNEMCDANCNAEFFFICQALDVNL